MLGALRERQARLEKFFQGVKTELIGEKLVKAQAETVRIVAATEAAHGKRIEEGHLGFAAWLASIYGTQEMEVTLAPIGRMTSPAAVRAMEEQIARVVQMTSPATMKAMEGIAAAYVRDHSAPSNSSGDGAASTPEKADDESDDLADIDEGPDKGPEPMAS
jgi:hypothetical protein